MVIVIPINTFLRKDRIEKATIAEVELGRRWEALESLGISHNVITFLPEFLGFSWSKVKKASNKAASICIASF